MSVSLIGEHRGYRHQDRLRHWIGCAGYQCDLVYSRSKNVIPAATPRGMELHAAIDVLVTRQDQPEE